MSDNKIYLGNLNKTVTEELLKTHFSTHGDITAINLPLDNKTLQPKGYAFITFSEDSAAQAALTMNEQAFLSQEIIVQIATEKRRKK